MVSDRGCRRIERCDVGLVAEIGSSLRILCARCTDIVHFVSSLNSSCGWYKSLLYLCPPIRYGVSARRNVLLTPCGMQIASGIMTLIASPSSLVIIA